MRRGFFALIAVISFTNAFAVVQDPLYRPRSECELALVDGFARLVAMSLTRNLLTKEQVNVLLSSSRPYNPLSEAALSVENVSVRLGFDRELVRMDETRWSSIRGSLSEFLKIVSIQNEIREDSRIETGKAFAPLLLEEFALPQLTSHQLRWTSKSGELTVEIAGQDEFRLGGTFSIEAVIRDKHAITLNGKEETIRINREYYGLEVGSRGLQELEGLYLSPNSKVISAASNGHVAFLAVWNGINRLNYYRFDGERLHFEHRVDWDGREPRIEMFVTSKGEMYAAHTDGSSVIVGRDVAGKYHFTAKNRFKIGNFGYWREGSDGRAFYYTFHFNSPTRKSDLVYYEIHNGKIQMVATSYKTEGREPKIEWISHPSGRSYLLVASGSLPIQIIEEGYWKVLAEVPVIGPHLEMAALVAPDGRILLAHLSRAKLKKDKHFSIRIFDLWNYRPKPGER